MAAELGDICTLEQTLVLPIVYPPLPGHHALFTLYAEEPLSVSRSMAFLCFVADICTKVQKELQIPQCKGELQIHARRGISGARSPLSRPNRFSRSETWPLSCSSVQPNGPILFLGAKFNCKKRRAAGDGRRMPGVEWYLHMQC